jgi:hypothetical protein
MLNSELYLHTKLCWSKGIFINPLPTARKDVYKIEITNNGVVKIGELEYDSEPRKGGLSVWHKIAELYKQFYNKLNE